MIKVLSALVSLFFLYSCQNQEAVQVISGPALISIESLDTKAFEETPLNTTRTMFLKVTNSGELTASDLRGLQIDDDAIIKYQGESVFPGEEGTCETTLASGESCLIALEFYPESTGNYELNFKLSFNDGVIPASKEIKISGNAGEVAVLKVEEDFDGYLGVHEPATLVEKIVKISNTGGLKAKNIRSLFEGAPYFAFKGGAFPGAGGSCANALSPGTSCELVISFLNPGLGNNEVLLNLLYNNALTEEVTVLSFSAISAEIIANLRIMGQTDFDYGKIIRGKKAILEFRLANSGYANASALSLSIPAPFSIESTNCENELAPAQSCFINIALIPDQLGKSSQELTINYANGKNPVSVKFPISYESMKPGNIRFLQSSTELSTLDLGVVGVNDERSIYLSLNNDGFADAKSISFEALPIGLTYLGASGCSSILIKNTSCNLNFKFKALASGSYEEQITVNYFDGAQTSKSVLTIKAQRKNLAVLTFAESGSALDFGTTMTNSSLIRAVKIKNIGTIAASGINVPALGPPINFQGGTFPGSSGDCSTDLAPLSECSIVFEINSPNAYQGIQSLMLTYFNSEESLTISKFVLVTVRSEAQLSLNSIQRNIQGFNSSPDNPKNLGDFNTVSDSRVILSFENTGGSELDGMNIEIVADHESYSSELRYVTSAEDDRSNCIQTLSAAERCEMFFYFSPTSNGERRFKIIVTYNGFESSNLRFEQDLIMMGKDLGLIRYRSLSQNRNLPLGNPNFPYQVDPVAQNGTYEELIRLQNIGTAPVTQINQTALTAPFSFSTEAQLPGRCGLTINPGEECLLGIRFSPTQRILYNSQSLLSYFDGSNINDDTLYVSGMGTTPANITISDAPEYDYGLVVVNTSKERVFNIRNTGGAKAREIQLTGLTLPYQVVSNNCPSDGLSGGSICQITVRFTPTQVGVLVTQNLSVNYFDGIENKSVTRILKGTGEPPLATHTGWAGITARGDKVNIYNVSSNDKEIRFSWNQMTSSATITGYQVFRRTATTEYDFNSPLINISNTSNRNFVDTDFSHGTIYFYTVRAIIMGLPSRSTQSFAEIRIPAPLPNMALVHRWMVNTDICLRMNKSIDRSNNHRCNYDGLGATADKYFDIGYDLLVDRFEVGQDLSSRFAQSPNSFLTQTAAQQVCQNQGTFNLIGHISNGVKKRLLSRKEWVAASSWSTSISSSQILTRESAATNTSNCNGQSGNSIEITGNNSGCTSRYGIEDMAGNAWEWTNERVLNRTGYISGGAIAEQDFKLDIFNDDLDNFEFNAITSEVALKDSTCISVPLRFPVNNSFCSEGSYNPANLPDGDASSLYNATYIPPTTGAQYLIAGGSFGNNGRSSVYTMAWVPSSFNQAAARCAIRVD